MSAPAALTPLDGPGFGARLDADRRSVTLPPGEAFFGLVDAADCLTAGRGGPSR